MAKTNSLKLVPFAMENTFIWEGNERKLVGTYMTLQEYTYGRPGDQTTVGYGTGGRPIEWRPNEPFEAELRLDRLERGRSAARFWFINEKANEQYPVFGQGLVELLKAGNLDHGLTWGRWIAVKRGANYGIERWVA